MIITTTLAVLAIAASTVLAAILVEPTMARWVGRKGLLCGIWIYGAFYSWAEFRDRMIEARRIHRQRRIAHRRMMVADLADSPYLRREA